MDELIYRLCVLVWFLAYTASIYLVLHILVARLSRKPDSRLSWFFGVVTGPLIWPVRKLAPIGAPEGRLRWLALGLYAAIWLGMRLFLRNWGGPNLG
jgi:hypothetical protein